MAASPESMNRFMTDSETQLHIALLKMRGQLRELICNAFFSTEFLGFEGGAKIIIDGHTYLAPDLIVYMLDRLEVLKSATMFSQMVRLILKNIKDTVEEKVDGVLWGKDKMTALCYRLLADTFELAGKLSKEEQTYFLVQRFKYLVPTLIFVKDTLERIRIPSADKARALLHLMQRDSSMTELDLSHCQLTIEEVMALVYLLPGSAITSLDLSGNPALSGTLMPLLQVLPQLSQLKSLVLTDISLTTDESKSLWKMIEEGDCQTKVNFTATNIPVVTSVEMQSSSTSSSSSVPSEVLGKASVSPTATRSSTSSSSATPSREPSSGVAGKAISHFARSFSALFSFSETEPNENKPVVQIQMQNLAAPDQPFKGPLGPRKG